MQQRYYDPQIGRLLSVDPIAARERGDNFNRYSYANNNPYRFTDPDGREAGGGYATGQYKMSQPDTAASKEVVSTVADFTPVVGDVKGAYEAYQNPTVVTVSAAIVGLVPIVGDLGAKLIKGADKIADVAKSAPDFIVSPGGTAFPVPKGATGPTPVINPAGKQTGVAFTGGAGGANGQVATMRIMDPNAKNPTGYVKYENGQSPPQGVDPYTGRTVPPDQAHHPIQ